MTGIKISKPGVNVQSGNPYDFNLNSKYPMFSIHSVFSGTVTDIGSQVLVTHNLGRKPMVLVWMNRLLGDPDEFLLHVNNTNLGQGFVTVSDTEVVLTEGVIDLDFYGYVFENLEL